MLKSTSGPIITEKDLSLAIKEKYGLHGKDLVYLMFPYEQTFIPGHFLRFWLDDDWEKEKFSFDFPEGGDVDILYHIYKILHETFPYDDAVYIEVC